MLRLVQIPASFQFGFLGPLQTGIMREELYAIFFALLFYFSLTLIISHIIGVPLVLEVRRLRRESLSVSVCISLCVCKESETGDVESMLQAASCLAHRCWQRRAMHPTIPCKNSSLLMSSTLDVKDK